MCVIIVYCINVAEKPIIAMTTHHNEKKKKRESVDVKKLIKLYSGEEKKPSESCAIT